MRRGHAQAGTAQCTFAVRASGGRPTAVAVSVDGAPSPYAVMERAAVEEAQLFTARRMIPAPQRVPDLGLDAYWFPAERHLMTTDGLNLITVTVPRRPTRLTRRALAVAAARPYLGPNHPRLAIGPA